MPVRKAPALRPGDAIAVVAPCSPFDREKLFAGLEILERAGFRPRYDGRIFERRRYLAGDDTRRLGELHAALRDPAVRCVWLVRGGYGITRLLGALDLAPLAEDPKLLVGFSDATALHAAWGRAGVASVHGPMVARLAADAAGAQRVLAMVQSAGAPPPLTGARAVVPGIAEGPLVGGNLAVLSRLIGTPFMPDLRGAILLLEDVNEPPYRLDREWTHLVASGALAGVDGIALGELTDCEEKGADYSADEVMAELTAALGVPVAAGFRLGHGAVNLAVPLGVRARLDAARGALELLEAPVS